MPHKLRKIRKTRGSRTQGYGRVGQHRGRGKQPNRKAGLHKAKWSYVVKYEPDYFGKRGFTSPKSLRHKGKVINISEVDEIFINSSKEKEDEKQTLDLARLGYSKLLGSGRISKSLLIKVPSCSKIAAEKIKEAGGQIITKSKKTGE